MEPITGAWADALAHGDEVFIARFGVAVEADWAVFEEVIPLLVQAAHSHEPAEWGPHLVFDDDPALVGNAGWKGPPVAGVAELGYAIAPARRGRGIATDVVRVLLSRARSADLRAVVAHTLAERSASTSVLERCGFTKVDELVDPEDGRVWRWEVWFVGEQRATDQPDQMWAAEPEATDA